MKGNAGRSFLSLFCVNVKVFFIIFVLQFAEPHVLASSKTVTIYSWWDYIPSEVIDKIGKKGIKINIIEYRSNEVALSKLLSSKSEYDIVIVSNWVLRVLEEAQKVDLATSGILRSRRNYLEFSTKFASSCIPYLWSTTTFAADSKNLKISPRSIDDLLALHRKSYTIGIVDDPIEYSARIVSDSKEKCSASGASTNVLDRLEHCSAEKLLKLSDKSERGFFRNTLEPILGPKSAVYGWHGEIGGQIDSLPTYEFYLPEGKPVFGLDYVCILKGRSNKLLPEVVELLTDEESTNINILKTQYFSPYVNDTGKYSPKVKKLKEELLERMKNESPIILTPLSRAVHAKINKWWQKVLYGN